MKKNSLILFLLLSVIFACNKQESVDVPVLEIDASGKAGAKNIKLTKVHKDDINNLFTNDIELWQYTYFSNTVVGYIVTFEHDWYAGE